MIYRFNKIPIKMSADLFFRKFYTGYKIYIEVQRIYNNHKKNKAGRFTLLDFKTYYKAT